jgi:CheY-like chemotaxis protein/anti-sigma regulatory factor (Ser/Thr protein kinase)
MINDVLDLARIEAGAMSVSPEPVELSALVDETLPLVQSQAAARGVRLVAPAPEAGGAWVRADRRRLKQVLSNLASNAVKYNRERGEVVLTLRPAADGRRVLEVRDTGRGFTPAQLAQLYQPFTRFVRDDEVQEGTGIGLVITRRLVELMGGRLEVQSAPDQGSVFSVELPAAEAPGPLPAPPPPLAVPPARTRDVTLLYVEDNPSNVELMQQVVRLRPGWRLEVATDGPQGLARALAGGLDAAVIDIDLPGFDGVELARRLRADPAGAALPLLALSANVMPADIRRAMGAGFDAYLTKPIDLPSMLARLDALFDRETPTA